MKRAQTSSPSGRPGPPWAPGARIADSLPSQISHRKSQISSAFTLIEVLVALVIFAMVVVVLGSAYLNVLISYEVVKRGTLINEDFAFARQQVLAEPDRKKLEEGGEFDTAGGRRAKWSVEIESSPVADVYKVTFTCEIADPTRSEPDRKVESFMVLRPTWVIDAGERGKLKEDAKTRILELQGKLKKA
ncbi:MAG: prepilin-type N-terminal cleavage/methylation domain-containing protein [Opitutus sp.]|nr:prepilin-type N-terminal cleavage/methylation domain-containing protein [Opitutus sp.]